jgi:hypothetical protein
MLISAVIFPSCYCRRRQHSLAMASATMKTNPLECVREKETRERIQPKKKVVILKRIRDEMYRLAKNLTEKLNNS